MATKLPDHTLEGFQETLGGLRSAPPLLKQEHTRRLLSQVDVLTDSREGLDHLQARVPELVEAGVFQDGPWENPSRLVPALVGGTLRAGGASTLLEILSELRIMAVAEGSVALPGFSRARARSFLREVLVNTLDLLFPGDTEADRVMDAGTRKKVDLLMALLLERVPLEEIKGALATEIELVCLQRPIVPDRALKIIRLVRENVPVEPPVEPGVESGVDSGDEREDDRRLHVYIRAVYAPSPDAGARSLEEYQGFLAVADRSVLEGECRALGATMKETGLAVGHHALLLREVATRRPLVSLLLNLDRTGQAELEKHREFVAGIIEEAIHPGTARSVYGLGRLLDRGILSHQPVLNGLERLRSLELHPDVEGTIRGARPGSGPSPTQHLLADCLGILGQPLGMAQGKNPTCQSARGISLWSRHAPGKLLGMIRTVAKANELSMRFEAAVIRSSDLGLGLMKEMDPDVDTVSLLLVPHLDRIYSEMMLRSTHRGDDPHKWVNPAMYGHWIPTGFLSAYDYGTAGIRDYDGFLRTFYATHHPDFNRGHDLAYPNPVGIFLTASSGDLIGFHAVSILRVRRVRNAVRIYFYNPNGEGRQRWHSDIRPTVAGNGERPGESSLPFHQFASRLYAFHFSPSDVGEVDAVHDEWIQEVTEAARASWGKAYIWAATASTP
jgi:hypothetical protein